MNATVLVIHGMGNRVKANFEGTVAALGQAVDLPDIAWVPVYWGDLGPATTDLLCVPRPSDRNDLPVTEGLDAAGLALELVAPQQVPVPRESAESVLARTDILVRERTGAALPSRVALSVGTALHAAADSRDEIRPEVAEVVAELVVSWPPVDSGVVEEGLIDRFTGALARVAQAIDRSLGQAIGDTVESLLRGAESGLDRIAANTVGDILTYEADGRRIRGRLDVAFRAHRQADRPIHIVAHSLGALAAAEWLLGAAVELDDQDAPTPLAERRIDRLVTFGSQVPLFAEFHGLLSENGDRHPAGVLPWPFAERVGHWTNVWHQFDPVAFVVNRTITPKNAEIADHRLTLDHVPRSIGELATAHSSYWKDRRFAAKLAALLGS
ncbi:hypothetical protein AB0A74_09645 [Saccharothrix sp. NPDC042600]|uniref:hypothetical protein n=1 Tax=Saccharothrix TaxID=2071 RepID=UPI0033E5C2EC|nr:hypothetical protein GCM10017745_35640 [Saccharothrix mutabilis subsp. capreolus]